MTKKTHYFELVILREREEGKKKGGEGQRKGQRETQVRMEEKRQEDTERKKQF